MDGREAQKGEDVCILIADSRCCIAEPNTTLLSNYPPIKKKKTTTAITNTQTKTFDHPVSPQVDAVLSVVGLLTIT